MKKCNKCLEHKDYSFFNKDKTRGDGHNNKCRSCMKQIQKEHYKKNSDLVKGKASKYRKENSEKVKETKRKSYLKCIKKERERRKIYYDKNMYSERNKNKIYREKFNDKYCFQKAKRRRLLNGYSGDLLNIELKIYQLKRRIKQICQ